ncbi:carnitine O-acetyltransferase b [Paramormyrops kingsleyae]|uniref:Carnitine O-acetyltransferase b n=1 Tax=Paramormyrops kingsleyae TaxID=1676925 RepID=A0A3B3SKC9_9TELE|nr:carnitine O-acetyltransferase-like [Paramormyrops kingsleyae]
MIWGKIQSVKQGTLLVFQVACRRHSRFAPVTPQPVPPLGQTMQRYLRALEPLLPPDELEHTREMVRLFGQEGGLGERLQQGLEKRARFSHNWISDWWVQWAYLESRQPLAGHSNPAIALPKQDYSDWRGQLMFASKLIAGVLDFKAKVDSGSLPVEYLRGQPLCMELYPLLFSSCRIPGPKHDHVVHYSQARRPPTHITVVRNFQFFQLEVYNSDGTPLTEGQIHAQLCRIRSQSWKTDKEPMGILTSEHRNTWGQAYHRLLRDKINKESVRAIERGIFTLCLDSPVMRISDDKYSSRMAAQMLHGGGTYSNSGNRWFDKTLQFVVGEDGSFGLLYEHATAEGPQIATLLDHVLEYCKQPDSVRAPLIPLPMPKKLYFYIDPEIKRDIEQAKQNLDILINDLDISCFIFRRFGKDFPKQLGLSPNAFIQVALQLAYYRVHSEICASCDSASLRMFRGGRTDIIRSPTSQALQFVCAFDDPSVSREAKVDLLREAVAAYAALTEQALQGQAIDRHLLGLKLQAIEEGLSVPRIFMDTAYGLATHWKLRTGQVPSNTDSVMCFGPLVPDGYAVCYNPQSDHVHFSVTAFNCCEETNAEKLAVTLESALCHLQELLHPAV